MIYLKGYDLVYLSKEDIKLFKKAMEIDDIEKWYKAESVVDISNDIEGYDLRIRLNVYGNIDAIEYKCRKIGLDVSRWRG